MKKLRILGVMCLGGILFVGCSNVPSEKVVEKENEKVVEKDSEVNEVDTINPIKQIALDDAKVSEGDVHFRKYNEIQTGIGKIAHMVFDDGTYVYFYKIDASTMDILVSKKVEETSYVDGMGGATSTDEKVVSDKDIITLDDAKAIALKDVGVSESDVKITKAKFYQYKNYEPKYEIEFDYNGLEYEYEISAISGTILKMEIDD